MFANVDNRIDLITMPQPEIIGQITVWWDQVGVVVVGEQIQVKTTRWLDADKGFTQADTREHNAPIPDFRIILRITPALHHRLLAGLWQGVKMLQIIINRNTLPAWKLM